jgi:hypothetical protein
MHFTLAWLICCKGRLDVLIRPSISLLPNAEVESSPGQVVEEI